MKLLLEKKKSLKWPLSNVKRKIISNSATG